MSESHNDSIKALEDRRQWLYDKIASRKANGIEHGFLTSEFVATGRAIEYIKREQEAINHKGEDTDSSMLRRLSDLFKSGDLRKLGTKQAKKWYNYLEDLATRLECLDGSIEE